MAALEPATSRPQSMCRRISSDCCARSDPYFEYEPHGACSTGGDGTSISSVDQPNVSSRCSVRLLHDIISKLSPQKVGLVRTIGFEGVLHLPLLKQINLRFSTWLMTRVDESAKCLVISDGLRIQLNKHDVAKVFGIPAAGSSILLNYSKSQSGRIEDASFVNSAAPAHFRSIKAAQEIVSRQFDCNMNPTEEDEFRSAFVVLVMSMLLAPAAKHDRVSDDYIHAIQNPAKIPRYDWAEYVLRRLLDAVAKLKLDIGNNVKAPYIYGCSLFLQVLYLDSIDIGPLSMPHDEFPRIRCFNSERIRSMIAADPSFNNNGCNVDVVCKAKLRDPSGVCYHWARSSPSKPNMPLHESRLLSLWQFAVSMTRVLGISPEAAGPVFIAASRCPEALRFMDLLLHLIEPYMKGFSYRPSVSLKSRPADYCRVRNPAGCKDPNCCMHLVDVRRKRKLSPANLESSSSCSTLPATTNRSNPSAAGRPFCCRNRSSHLCGGGYDPSHVVAEVAFRDSALEEVDIQAISEMARFYLQLSPVKPTRCSDLNFSPQHDDQPFSSTLDGRSRAHENPMTPWQLGCIWNFDFGMSSAIMQKLHLVDDIDVPWIANFCPKYIELATWAVKEQFLGLTELELEMVDAVIRRFKQIDDEIYPVDCSSRWRHYVESDFLVSLLAGCFNILDPVQRAHFCGRHINYDVTTCRLFIFPVMLQYRWACFAWRMEDNTIVVYDPCSFLSTQPERLHCYERVANLLRSAMGLVSSLFFDGWCYDWQEGRLEVFQLCNPPPMSWNRSGLMCLYFCRCYDGSTLSPYLDMAQIDDISGMILAEVSALSGNMGVVPSCIRESVAKQITFPRDS